MSDKGWLDGLRGAAIAAEIMAQTAISPLAPVDPGQVQVADPVLDAGLSALVEAGDALEAGAEAQRIADEISEEIDVVDEVSTSEPAEDTADTGEGSGL